MNASANDKIVDFFASGKTVGYKPKEIIIREDDEPSGVCFLQSGYVRMDSVFEDGSEITFNVFKPGSVFPVFWAVGGIENSYNYCAMSPVWVQRRSREDFLKFLSANPEVLFEITRRIIVGIDGLLHEFKNSHNGNSRNKVAAVILMLGKRFGRAIKKGKIFIDIKLTHQDIARFAGLARETTSLAVKKFEDAKIITIDHGYLCINSMKDLEKLCENRKIDPSACVS